MKEGEERSKDGQSAGDKKLRLQSGKEIDSARIWCNAAVLGARRKEGESLGGDILVPGAISRDSPDSRVHALALGRHDRWDIFSWVEKLLPLVGAP